MNFLAHHWLAGPSEALQLGAWLGDFVKGRANLENYQQDVRLGMVVCRIHDQ